MEGRGFARSSAFHSGRPRMPHASRPWKRLPPILGHCPILCHNNNKAVDKTERTCWVCRSVNHSKTSVPWTAPWYRCGVQLLSVSRLYCSIQAPRRQQISKHKSWRDALKCYEEYCWGSAGRWSVMPLNVCESVRKSQNKINKDLDK